jgi:hypothetical protein
MYIPKSQYVLLKASELPDFNIDIPDPAQLLDKLGSLPNIANGEDLIGKLGSLPNIGIPENLTGNLGDLASAAGVGIPENLTGNLGDLASAAGVGELANSVTNLANTAAKAKQLVDGFGGLVNPNKEVVLTSLGQIFDKIGINFDKGDFSKAIELFQTDSPESTEVGGLTFGSPDVTSTKKVPPTAKDIKQGIMKRYFIKNKCTGTIAETTKPRFLKLRNTVDKCIELEVIDWIVAGIIEDTTVNGYFLEGVKTKNEKVLSKLEKKIPGIRRLIPDPVEYVKGETIPTTSPIVEQERDIIIPSPGKSL